MNGFKEYSSCGALYTKSCGCSKGSYVDKFVRDPNKTPDSSQRPLMIVSSVETQLMVYIVDNDPGENSSQSSPHINHHCCYGCGDSLDDENSFAYDSTPNFVDDSPNVFNPPSQPPTYSYEKIPIYYDDDDDEESSTPLRDIIISELPLCIEITPVLSTKETKDSLIMRDEHLDTILEKESDEFIKSSVKNLVPNPSESGDLSNIGQSLLNQDSSIISSSKIDSLLDEFASELIFLKSIPPRIDEADCDPEEEIRLIKKLLYDNSSPRPLEEPNSKNFDAIIESFSLSPIPSIENDDYESEGDILILEELLSNGSFSFPKNESFHFDIPSSLRPPVKPPNVDEIKPVTGILTVKVVGDISKHYVLMPRLLPTQPTLALNEEKSSHLLSYRGFKAFQLSSESPTMIYGRNIPILDVLFFHFYPP
uniref:Reverse transcriptase domain-containing protein n=1 Tax=Tanacetum cinerariifolium TaxID=118510 RepID=A0A6L2JRG8_TANCI|nr:hypothetical protein [Tanacetum cinerariifolium]